MLRQPEQSRSFRFSINDIPAGKRASAVCELRERGILPIEPLSDNLCLDITKSGDVSLKSYDAKAPINKNSALIWAFGGPIQPPPKKGPQTYFSSTVSTAARGSPPSTRPGSSSR